MVLAAWYMERHEKNATEYVPKHEPKSRHNGKSGTGEGRLRPQPVKSSPSLPLRLPDQSRRPNSANGG